LVACFDPSFQCLFKVDGKYLSWVAEIVLIFLKKMLKVLGIYGVRAAFTWSIWLVGRYGSERDAIFALILVPYPTS
jgi:hypothetical protein